MYEEGAGIDKDEPKLPTLKTEGVETPLRTSENWEGVMRFPLGCAEHKGNIKDGKFP